MTPHQERLGLLFAALCALNGALVPAVAKLTTDRAAPLFVATATTLFGAAFAALVLGVRGDLPLLVRGRTGLRLAFIGALGTGLAYQLFFAGASRSSAIETVLCLQIEPAYSLLAAWLALGHRPTRRRVAAIAILLVGIALAVGGHGIVPSRGAWLLLVTPLCWQASHLIVLRGLVGVSPTVLAGARYLYGGAVLTLCWLFTGGLRQLPAADTLPLLLPLLAFQGVVLSFVGTLLWYQAVTRLDLARTTAIVVPSIPLLSLLASFLLLGEVPTVRQWAGLLLTAAGVRFRDRAGGTPHDSVSSDSCFLTGGNMDNTLKAVGLLVLSNMFMTMAWYGHLRFKGLSWPMAILVSWGLAFFEYLLQVPANRIGYRSLSAYQLKIIQESITLVIFIAFAALWLGEGLRLKYAVSFALILAGTVIAFL